MPTFKLVLSDKGKAKSYEIKDPESRAFLGLKIGDVLDGKVIGIHGKIKITGGSDKAGIPMRWDVKGGGKKYVLLSSPPCFKPKRKGERRRKMVRGNTITDEIYQINAKLIGEGDEAKNTEAA